ncbi:MAG TPA: hypothetical protein VG817_01320, partial [Gemmatimonadales bacterium]|nr:hypothetical protein [Gemmatimonadales bacterium]
MVTASVPEADLVLAALAPMRWFGRLYFVLGWAMLIIGTVGSLVVMRAWLVTSLPELGLRAAVGATRVRLLVLILGRLVLAIAIAVAFAAWVAPGVRAVLTQVVGSDVGGYGEPLLLYTLLLVGGALAGLVGPLRLALTTPPAGLLEHSAE